MKKIITLLLLLNSFFLFSQNNEKQNENLIYDSNSINVKPEFPEGLENLNTFLIKTGIKAKTKKEEKTETKMFAMFEMLLQVLQCTVFGSNVCHLSYWSSHHLLRSGSYCGKLVD